LGNTHNTTVLPELNVVSIYYSSIVASLEQRIRDFFDNALYKSTFD